MVELSTARHEANRGDGGFAEVNAGLQPAAVLKPDRDNDTSVIRGPAIRKAGWRPFVLYVIHAFFTGLKDNPTVERLVTVFSKSVIPLLQEYFYEDYQKIQFVLGDNGKTNEDYKFIKDTEVVVKNIFKGSIDEVIDLPDKKYEINEEALKNIESYKEIM